jgi:two-component system, response regulator YesN
MGSGPKENLYSITIVDDEQVIRNGLKSVVDWEALGFTIVSTFSSAADALPWLQKHRPDVLLVDICMPGMDGLELIERAGSIHDCMVSVVLSGYDSFEYARKAIDRGVFGYLLKPVREQKLEELFTRLKQKLDNLSRHMALEAMTAESDAAHQLMLLLHGGTLDPMGLQRLLSIYPGLNSFTVARVMLLELVPVLRTKRGDKREKLIKSISMDIETELKKSFPAVRSPDRALIHIILSGTEEKAIGAVSVELFERATAFTEGKEGIDLSGALGRPVKNIQELRGSLVSAATTIQERRFKGTGQLLLWEDFSETVPLKLFAGTEDFDLADKLVDAVVANSAIKAGEVVHQLFERFSADEISDRRHTEQRTGAFIERLCIKLSFHGIPGTVTRKHMQEAFEKAFLWPTYELIAELMEEELVAFLGISEVYRCDPRNASIMEAVEHIRNYINTDISLELLAERAQMSTSYFCRLFKHVIGENFKDYLIHQRLEMAKQRLCSSSEKIYEIAESVGFKDQQYFSYVFKRKIGVTPLEYRNRSVEYRR